MFDISEGKVYKMSKTVKSTIILFIAAMIWGSAFVAQRAGMDSIGPFYFSALRSLIGSASLCIPFLISAFRNKNIRNKDNISKDNISCQNEEDKEAKKEAGKTLLTGGLVCGVVAFFAMNFQQVALVSVDAGKTGFITALYIVIVPLLGIFFKRKVSLFTWIGVALAVIGLYFLCITSEFSIMPEDLIVLVSALFWACHIMCLGHFAPKIDAMKLTATQFFVAGILSLLVAVVREPISASAIYGAWFPIAYTGIFSTAIAFSLQAFGQKHANTTVAAIIMSTESLFAAISGFIILGETFTSREGLGCVLMFSAVIIAQLPSPSRSKEKDTISAECDESS